MSAGFLLGPSISGSAPSLETNAQAAPSPALTSAQWHEDLNFLATELPKRHANAFHFISKTNFDREVTELDQKLDRLNRDEIFVGMDQIENSIGDGHNYIRIPGDAPLFSAHFEKFGDDYRLVSAADAPGVREALGGRLAKIDDVPIDHALAQLMMLTPADETQSLRDVRAAALLSDGMVLHGLGIISSRERVRYTVITDNGNQVTLDLQGKVTGPPPVIATDILPAGWLSAAPHPALYLQRPDQDFWCTYLQPSQTEYCNFRSYKDMEHTSRVMTDVMRREHPRRLVIDLRLNGGGDWDLGLKYVVNPVRRMPGINRKGRLFVLIGARTFSAAMANAVHFRQRTQAALVGQPIGEKPDSYQEAREMALPNSHWIARYSVKFYRFTNGGENLIRPDREITESWADFLAGKDPVLDWCLGPWGG